MDLNFLKIAAGIMVCCLLASCGSNNTINNSENSLTSASEPSTVNSLTDYISSSSSPIANTTQQYSSQLETVSDLSPFHTSEAVQTEDKITTNIEIVSNYSPELNFVNAEFSYQSFNDKISGNTMPYRLYVPKDYDPNKKYPVILFLHGAGEIGSDNNIHLKNFSQCFSVVGDILKDSIIICPQTPSNWSLDLYEKNDKKGYLSISKRILDSVVSEYNGDRDRLYLTGLSLGSFATWTMIDNYPNIFAAAVSVCGGGGSYASQSRINTPIWMFHGTADTTVPYSSSQSTYNAIVAAGGENIRFTTLNGVSHNAWDYAYKDREMFSWMFNQNLKTYQSKDYTYICAIEVTTADGNKILDENGIDNLNFLYDNKSSYIELRLNDESYTLLKDTYDKNNNEIFTLKISQKCIYKFKFTASPEKNSLRIENTYDNAKLNSVHWFIKKLLD